MSTKKGQHIRPCIISHREFLLQNSNPPSQDDLLIWSHGSKLASSWTIKDLFYSICFFVKEHVSYEGWCPFFGDEVPYCTALYPKVVIFFALCATRLQLSCSSLRYIHWVCVEMWISLCMIFMIGHPHWTPNCTALYPKVVVFFALHATRLQLSCSSLWHIRWVSVEMSISLCIISMIGDPYWTLR